ncbi:MAG: PIG-L family deacetylase [Candidatus Omnitrophota bacterium]
MNILAIGAHPDDIEYGCGGALAKLSGLGHQIHLLVMTKGEVGARGKTTLRAQEQMRSAKILRAKKVFWGGYKDTRISLEKGLIDRIEKTVKRVNPTFIFVNYLDDTHQDHRVVAQATNTATRYTKNVLFYEVPSTQNFNPTVFIDIQSVLNLKMACLEAHASQVTATKIKDLTILDSARSNAIFRGIQGRVKFAEAFVPSRLFIAIEKNTR